MELWLLLVLLAALVLAATGIFLVIRHRRALPAQEQPPAELPSPISRPAGEPAPRVEAEPVSPRAPPEPPELAAPPLPPLPPSEPVVPPAAVKPSTVVPAIVRAGKRAALRGGLEATRGGFVKRLGRLFTGATKLSPELLGEIEEVLLTADIGVRTAQKLIAGLRETLSSDEARDPQTVWKRMKEESCKLLRVESPSVDLNRARPFVILLAGVNGVGKTTTIGKLAAQYAQQGKRVLLAAGDTFRAAATEQLEVWGARTGCPVIRGKEGTDPSSVIFDAIRRAISEDFDIVLADTAGRLHTKQGLMDELQKVRRVSSKALEGAPHETFLVLDATNGQNAIAQAQLFNQAMQVSGIVLTKLDGTAKGGVILGICGELGLPVRYIGIGERVEDLRAFDPEEFVEALYEDVLAEEAA